MGRPEQRKHLEDAVRLEWAERDIDGFEERLDEWEKRQDARFERFDDRLGANTKTLIAILASVAVAGVLLGINVWLVMAR